MSKAKYDENELIGKKFNHLTVLNIFKKNRNNGNEEKFAECICDRDNNHTVVYLYNLLKGISKSCGCLKGISKRKENVLENKYGRWTVIDDSSKSRKNGRFVIVQCSCEKKTIKNVSLSSLKSGGSQSCGCIKEEYSIGDRSRTHGLTKHPIYDLFNKIINRCYNKEFIRFGDWGGRGIYVCDEWRDDFQAFYDWCINNGWKAKLQIDRINNDGPYSPGNCRFVNNQENTFNQRLIKTNNTSGYRGVSYQNQTGYYGAYVRFNGKSVFYEGKFNSPKDAALSRDKFIIREGLPHKLNFPELAISWCL